VRVIRFQLVVQSVHAREVKESRASSWGGLLSAAAHNQNQQSSTLPPILNDFVYSAQKPRVRCMFMQASLHFWRIDSTTVLTTRPTSQLPLITIITHQPSASSSLVQTDTSRGIQSPGPPPSPPYGDTVRGTPPCKSSNHEHLVRRGRAYGRSGRPNPL
jgi:hypothetical protein